MCVCSRLRVDCAICMRIKSSLRREGGGGNIQILSGAYFALSPEVAIRTGFLRAARCNDYSDVWDSIGRNESREICNRNKKRREEGGAYPCVAHNYFARAPNGRDLPPWPPPFPSSLPSRAIGNGTELDVVRLARLSKDPANARIIYQLQK